MTTPVLRITPEIYKKIRSKPAERCVKLLLMQTRHFLRLKLTQTK